MLPLATLLQEAPPEAGLQLSWIDWVGVGLFSVFAVLGLLRGLWWQVMRLIGIVAAVALARTFSAPWGDALEARTDWSHEVATGVVWVGLFVLGLVATAIVGTLGKKSLQAMQLGLADRFGGLLAGVATGGLLHVAWLVVMAHLGPQPWTADVLDGTYSRNLLQAVTTRYPVLTRKETYASDSMIQWLGDRPAASPGGGASFGPSDGASGSKVK